MIAPVIPHRQRSTAPERSATRALGHCLCWASPEIAAENTMTTSRDRDSWSQDPAHQHELIHRHELTACHVTRTAGHYKHGGGHCSRSVHPPKILRTTTVMLGSLAAATVIAFGASANTPTVELPQVPSSFSGELRGDNLGTCADISPDSPGRAGILVRSFDGPEATHTPPPTTTTTPPLHPPPPVNPPPPVLPPPIL